MIERMIKTDGSKKNFNSCIHRTSLFYSNPDVCFGLAQTFGGPCGILSVVQVLFCL